MMYEISDQGLASIVGALALAVMLCFGVPAIAADQPPTPANPSEESATPSAGAPAKSFTEEDVDKRVQEVIAERTKDGAFVFHDPKLDADLNLVFEQIKIVRGMEGYGWFANTIFHDKDEPKKQYAIDFSAKQRRIPRQAPSTFSQGCRRVRGPLFAGRQLDFSTA